MWLCHTQEPACCLYAPPKRRGFFRTGLLSVETQDNMLPDLKRLILLQRLENTKVEALRATDAIPARLAELDARLDTSSAGVDAARQRLADQKTARQTVEKRLAEAQARLFRFKEQLMAVKTNKEYSAMQKEISTAETDVHGLEDDILEHMLSSDDLATKVKEAEQTEQAERTKVERARTALEAERSDLEKELIGTLGERSRLTQEISPETRDLFDSIASQRQGIAVVEARNGHCTLCNVRLRPQVFNKIMLNAELIRCDSCMRILFHNPDGQTNILTRTT